MRMDHFIFWRASLVGWIALLILVAVAEVCGHAYPHPVEVLVIPIIFAIFSAGGLARELSKRRRRRSANERQNAT
jgi:hypothetical protein